MRPETDELQGIVVGLAVNQHQIGLDVAIAVVFPVANQRVIAVLFGQRLVIRQGGNNGDELACQRLTMGAFALPPITFNVISDYYEATH